VQGLHTNDDETRKPLKSVYPARRVNDGDGRDCAGIEPASGPVPKVYARIVRVGS